MFRKLVSNIPFHPTLIDSIAFYMHRIKKEESVRRLGFIMIGLVLLLQIYSVIYPSRPSLATSTNDIIYGASSKEQILNAYRNNRDALGRTDIKAIFNHYGIGEQQIIASKPQRIGSQDRNYISTGRGTSPGIDQFIKIEGAKDGGIYQRSLSSWDTNGRENLYDTLSGMSTFGFRFWLIVDGCGNIVFENGSLAPNVEVNKKLLSKRAVKPGEHLEYLIQFRNSGLNIAKGIKITDTLEPGLEYIKYDSNINLKFTHNKNQLEWTIDNKNSSLASSKQWSIIKLYLKTELISEEKTICNNAYIKALNLPKTRSSNPDNEKCFEIKNYLCPDTNYPIPPGGIAECTRVCPDSSVINYDDNCPPAPKNDDSNPMISANKSVSNLTQNIIDANNTTANPGDRLKYTISLTNYGNTPAIDLEMNGEYGESINDVLEYSDLIDIGDANFNKQTNYLSWGVVTIPPGKTINKSFIVQIKNPLPSTPVSSSDPLSFDYIMHNRYGKSVVIKLNKPASKIVEQSVEVLPNTGTGTNMVIFAAILSLAGYLFFRSRLLYKELAIINREYKDGGAI